MNFIKRRKIGLFIAFAISIIILIINLRLNLLKTAFVRSSLAFIFFYFLCWFLRGFYIVFSTHKESLSATKHIELNTSQEEDQKLFREIYQTNHPQKSDQIDFQPLEFEKISKDEQKIEQIVKGIRVWSQDD
ncbi:hypothetical protein [Tepidibacillus sp. LV47]|uniref:hypothetical protein n=1 Tax=Tepidibacillus sp. LV47 TaxID=3398228 RepID=UPI003AAF6F92